MTYYGNATDFRTYHTARSRSIPAEWTDEVIEAALLVATEWLDRAYTDLFIGYKLEFLQTLEWPREAAETSTYPSYVFPNDVIPDQVVDATYEAAYREATENGSLQKDYDPANNKYNKTRVEGAIDVEYNNSLDQASDFQLQIPVINSILKPVLNESANLSGLSGAAHRL